MRRNLAILFVLALAAVASCSRTRVIPPSKLALIYEDMFVADQWIKDNNMSTVADTLLVYEPIFRKYGYTTQDYQKTVDKYMEDPEQFAAILDMTAASLQAHIDALKEREILKNKADSIRNVRKGWNVLVPEPYSKFFEGQVPTDSIHMELDSNFIWQLVRIEKDTMYRGPALIIREKADTLDVVADTLEVAGPDSNDYSRPSLPKVTREFLPDPQVAAGEEEILMLEDE